MKEKYTNENLLIERYLGGTLSTEEQKAFEELFLSSPGLLDELEAAECLQSGLHDITALEKAHTPVKPVFNTESIFRSPRYSIAASFLLLVSLGVSSVLLRENAQLSELNSDRALPTEIIPLVSVRGVAGGELNTLSLGGSPKYFVMMLDPGFEPYSHYRATIYRLNPPTKPSVLWQMDEMVPGYEEMLALSVPSSVFSPGDFEVHLEGWQEEWPPAHGFESIDSKTFRMEK
jgi:hypothetical protein